MQCVISYVAVSDNYRKMVRCDANYGMHANDDNDDATGKYRIHDTHSPRQPHQEYTVLRVKYLTRNNVAGQIFDPQQL